MFRPATFPPELAYGSVGGPEFATDVFTSPAGWEERRGHYLQNRGRWTVSLEGRTGSQISLLLHFFRCVAVGQAYSFLFRDFTDFQFATVLGIGDGTTMGYQLFKRYEVGSAHFDRILTKPDALSVRVTINGIATSAFSVDALTGMLTFTSAPVAGARIIATGEFDCMVRFASDTLQLQAIDPGVGNSMVFDAQTIELLEVLNEEGEEAALVLEDWHHRQVYSSVTFGFREDWET